VIKISSGNLIIINEYFFFSPNTKKNMKKKLKDMEQIIWKNLLTLNSLSKLLSLLAM